MHGAPRSPNNTQLVSRPNSSMHPAIHPACPALRPPFPVVLLLMSTVAQCWIVKRAVWVAVWVALWVAVWVALWVAPAADYLLCAARRGAAAGARDAAIRERAARGEDSRHREVLTTLPASGYENDP